MRVVKVQVERRCWLEMEMEGMEASKVEKGYR